LLEPGTPAPDFTAPDHHGNAFALSDTKGRWALLWWYPKAGTPG